MPNMSINITVELTGDPVPQSYNGIDVSDAQDFLAGLTVEDVVSTQVLMRCTTTAGEGRSLQRGAVGAECESVLIDAGGWLTENAAYE